MPEKNSPAGAAPATLPCSRCGATFGSVVDLEEHSKNCPGGPDPAIAHLQADQKDGKVSSEVEDAQDSPMLTSKLLGVSPSGTKSS